MSNQTFPRAHQIKQWAMTFRLFAVVAFLSGFLILEIAYRFG
jgi:hypothetical protein